jgi:hypothetical protein
MLYATGDCTQKHYGHVGEEMLTKALNFFYNDITEIQADGDELVKCCEILGRQLPKCRVYTFLGNNAQEIARNWDSK